MSHQTAIDELVERLAAISPSADPLLPVYEVFCYEQALTLQAIREHSLLLQECAGRAQEQVETIQRVNERCQSLPPTTLPGLPLGF